MTAARFLLVVARSETSLHLYLTARFEDIREVQVVRDRRIGERRRSPISVDVERRRGRDRRTQHGDIPSLGFIIVRRTFIPDGATS